MYMMKNLFRVGMGRMAALFAIVCCLTLTTNQTFAQCDAGAINAPTNATVCTGVAASTDITTAVVDIPTGAGAGLYGAYTVTITDGVNTATVLFEGIGPGTLLTAADVNAATITVTSAGAVTVAGAGANSLPPVVTIAPGTALLPGNYAATGQVYLGTDPAPNGALINQDACVLAGTNVTAASAPFELVGNFLDPSGINPLTNYDCVSQDAAQIIALAVTNANPNYSVNAATEVYSDAGLTTAYAPGDALVFPNPPLFVPANTVWSLTVEDNDDCESTISGLFETPEADILALSNDYCQFDAAHLIFGDPNGAPYVGPITDPTDPLVNDLPAGTFTTDAVPASLIDNGDNTATFDPFLAGPGQHSVFFQVGTDPDCQAQDQQIINIYPSFLARFDDPTTGLPTVVCQGANGGTITFQPDDLANMNATFTTFEGVFFVVTGNGIADEVDAFVNFDGTGVVDGGDGTATFDTNLAPGTYTVTLFAGYEQCSASQSHSITIVEEVDATLAAYALCGQENGGQVDLNAMFGATTTAGGTFATVTAGVTIAGDVLTYPAGFSGDVAVTYSVGDAVVGGDCFDNTGAATLTINDSNPAVFFDAPSNFCGDATPIDLTAFVTGGDVDLPNGEFFVDGVSIGDGTAWAPVNADATFALRYVQTNAGTCNNVAMQIASVSFAGDATMADLAVCQDAGEQFLEELAADYTFLGGTAGTFTGPGVVDIGGGFFSFFPATVSGTVPVQYCIGSGDCEECETFLITVHPDFADPVLTAPANVCADAGMLNLSSYLNANAEPGTFTASAGVLTTTAAGVMLDVSAVADATDVTITYTVDATAGVTFNDGAAGVDGAANACYTSPAPAVITVNGAVDASFTTNATPFICAGTNIDVTATGTVLGTNAITFNGAAATASIATAGLDGLYEITHTVTNGACSSTASSMVYIIGTAVSTTAASAVCADEGDLIALLGNVDAASTAGGTFAIVSGNGTISGDQLVVGTDLSYDISYTVGIEGQCDATSTFTVTVTNYIDSDFTFPETVCAGGIYTIDPAAAAAQDISASTLPITVSAVNADGTVDVQVDAAANGLFTLTHTTTNGTCTETTSQNVLVISNPVAAFTPAALTHCSDAGTVDLTQYLDSSSTPQGDFTGTGVTGNSWDPAGLAAADGPFVVTYTVGCDANNTATATLTITLVEATAPTTFDLISSVCAGETIDLSDYVVGDDAGTFSANGGVVVGDDFTAPDAGGTITITYANDNGGCGYSLDQVLLITAPATGALEDNIVCQSADDWSIDLTQYLEPGSTINGGTFQFAGIGAQATAFINEVEYSELASDNIGTGDFIEVAGAAGTDLRDYLIVVYEPNQFVVNDTPQFGETNGRIYAVISPELGYGWKVDYTDLADQDVNNNKWCLSPDVLNTSTCAFGDVDVFQVRSVEQGAAGDWIIDGTYGAANGMSYGALAIDLGDEVPDACDNNSTWEGLKDGPAAIALVYKGDFDGGEGVYDTGDAANPNENGNSATEGYCVADMTVTQFIGYGGMGSTNLGIFTAVDGPAAGLSTTDINVMDSHDSKSVQFTNAGWVVPNVTDAELNYPDADDADCDLANDGDNSEEDQSRGYLNWGQLASGNVSVSGCDNSSAEENYFDYIAPNGDILDLSHFDPTLFVGGLVANESDVYSAGADGDSDGTNTVSFDFTKNQVLPICFNYQVPSGGTESLCADTDVCLYVMMDYEEYWEAPAFICEGDGEQNMNDWILETVSFVPFTIQDSGSQTFSANIECDENIPSLFISELNYFGKNVTSTDEHCITYNYIQDAFAGGGFGGVTFIDYNPATDNVTVKFCDGVEISGLTGTDLSCYQLVFYRPDPTLVANGVQSSSLSYDVVYIDENGFPVSTDVENLVYMDLYGTIDDDLTPDGDNDDTYFGFNGTTAFRLDGSNPAIPGFGSTLDLRDPADRAKIEFISAPTEFYTISNPQDNALVNSIPNYNGPCGIPFSPIDINADCNGNFIDPDGVPVSPLAGGIYVDINGNGLVDVGTDLLVFKDRDGSLGYNSGEQVSGTACGTAEDIFPWERDTECANDASGRLTSGDAFTNRGRSNVGARWFPVLDIDENVSGVGLYNKCNDVGPITDDLPGETLEFLSWGERLCVQNEADFTEAGPFEQQFSEVIDSLDAGFGDLRSLQLMSCSDLPASLVSGCGSCTGADGALIPGATVWVSIFNGGAIKIPVCPAETAVSANNFSNSIGYYNCQLDEDVSEAAPCTVEVEITDADLPDNYTITSFLVQATANGGFVYQWELGDRTGCYYDESVRGCAENSCAAPQPSSSVCLPGESSLGVVADLVTGQTVNGFTLVNGVGSENGPLGCDFAFVGESTKVAERTFYLDIAAAVGQQLNFPVIPSGADSCYNVTQDGTFTATLAVAINYEQCHYVGDFSSSDATVDGNIALNLDAEQGGVIVDPHYTLDPAGLQDYSPILLTYDIPNMNAGDADEATDDVYCIDNNTDEDQRDQLVNIIYSDPAELVDGALTVCSTGGPVNLVNLLAPGTPASGEFSAAAGLSNAFSFDPAAAGAGAWTITYTTNIGSQCQNSDDVTINVVEVAVQAPSVVCSTDDVTALSSNVEGTWAGAGVVAVEGGFAFDPAAAGAGTAALTFTTADCSGETAVNVTVNSSPNADFFVPSQACMADGDIVFAVLGDENGTFTVNGEAIEGNVWTPNAAGYVAVEYTVMGANGCSTTELNHVNVFDVFNPSWTHDAGFTVCENDLPLTLTVDQTGGTWTADINSSVTVEEQEITEEVTSESYVYTIDGATNDTLNIDTITTVETVVIGTVEVITFDADIENADHGAFSVTYEGGGANCGQAQTHVINVYNIPAAPEVTPDVASLCAGDDAPVLEMTGDPSYCNCPVTFHVYDGNGNLVHDGDTFNEDVFDTGSVIDGPGDYTFSVVTVNKVCESDAVEINVSVNEAPAFDHVVGCTDPATGEAGIEIDNVTTEGPYSVSINGSEFFAFVPDQSLNVLLGGEINTVVVQDGNGCQSPLMEIPVDEPVSFDAVSDCPDADGNSTVTVVPAGGTAPYQVAVNGGAYGEFDELTVAVEGSAIVRVKDSKGCESQSRAVSTNDPVTFTASASCPDENGQSTITITPVNPNNTYVVTVGDIDLDEGVLEFQAGSNVTVVVTSTTTGCASAPSDVEVPAAATLTVETGCPTFDNITGQSFTSVTFGVEGISTVFIDGNAIAGTSASLTAGTYEVMAVNADGCESATQTVEITDNVEIDLINASSQTIVCGLGDIILAPTGAGEGATYNYYLDSDGTIPATPASGDVWVNSEIVGPRIIYVIATTANGCESAPLAASTYHYDELSVGDVSTTCNESDNSYTVTFTIAGGNGVYTVNGASAPESWTSGPIAQGEGYSFTIDDSPLIPSCESLTVAGPAPECVQAPIAAVDDFGATTPGEEVIINILTNDSGCSLDVGGILVSPSCGQIVDINAETGVVVYVADADTDCIVDTFVYEVIDCNGQTTTATVTIFIEQVGGELIVQVERDCTNAEESGVYTLNVFVVSGTAPFTITGSINEELETVGNTFTIITDGNPFEVSVVDATGAEFFVAGGEIACTKLAVDFIDFYGAVEADGNALTWSTATEENNDFFVVEYSTDGNVFAPIGTVDGAGTTNEAAIYNFLHRNAPNGVSYYRVKAVAFDGEATYTGVISLVRGERVFDIVSVYPIPVSSVVNVNFTTKVKGSSTIQIHNVAGKLMSTQDVDTEDGINKVSLNVSSYPVGTYFLTVKNGEEVATTKFVKE